MDNGKWIKILHHPLVRWSPKNVAIFSVIKSYGLFSLGQVIYALSDCQNNFSHVGGKIYAMSEKNMLWW